MPPGTVIPELAYADVREAVDWLCRAFGFAERLRIGDHRAQLTYGEGSIVVTRLPDGAGPVPPERRDHAVMVQVPDVDRHHEQAYGERQYTADDPGGHRWTFSQSIADVDPASWGGILRG
jgi:uncharacterized glyoxalase superfamily protein PhnB